MLLLRQAFPIAVLAATLGASQPDTADRPASAAGSPIAVTLFTHTVAWRTAPRSLVTADLRRDGRLQSQAEARATDGGDVTLYFSDYRLDREGRDAALRPGDLVALRSSGAGGSLAVTVTLPTLLVVADPEADRIAGQAEPGAQLHLRLLDDTAPAGSPDGAWDLVADAAGRFALDLAAAAGGGVDLRAGHHGSVTFTTPEGQVVSALFAVFEAELTLGSPRPRGRGTPGQRLDVVVEHGDSTREQDTVALVDGVDWVLPGADTRPTPLSCEAQTTPSALVRWVWPTVTAGSTCGWPVATVVRWSVVPAMCWS